VAYDKADIDARCGSDGAAGVGARREPAPRLDVIVGPGALLREVGGRSVMRKQVAHLHDLEDRGLVSIRVPALGRGRDADPRAVRAARLRGVTADPAVTYVEIPGGARYLEAEQS
jgi:hypothetical protein